MAEENRFEVEMTRMMNIVIRKLDGLETDVSGLKSDVTELKSDVSTLKVDVSDLKSDVSTLKVDVSDLKSDVSTLKVDVSDLKSDVSTLKSDVSEIKEVQKEHSQILKRLDAKTDSIAETVLNHEIRITKLEKDVSDSHKGVH